MSPGRACRKLSREPGQKRNKGGHASVSTCTCCVHYPSIRDMSRITLVSFLVLLVGQFTFAQPADSSRPAVTAVRISQKLNLTGKLDDPQWQLAKPVELPYEITPGENTPAPQRT